MPTPRRGTARFRAFHHLRVAQLIAVPPQPPASATTPQPSARCTSDGQGRAAPTRHLLPARPHSPSAPPEAASSAPLARLLAPPRPAQQPLAPAPRPPPRPAPPHPGPGAAVTMVMAEGTAVLRRNRPGTKAQVRRRSRAAETGKRAVPPPRRGAGPAAGTPLAARPSSAGQLCSARPGRGPSCRGLRRPRGAATPAIPPCGCPRPAADR